MGTKNSQVGSYRTRYSYGVSVHVHASGSFHFFDYNAMLLVISSSIVFLSLPNTIMRFIALFFVGGLSRIYTSVACETFDLVKRLHCVCARLLGYKEWFHSLTEQKDKLREEALKSNMIEVLQEEQNSGVLCEDEINMLSSYMFAQLDTDKKGAVELLEFLRACNS